VAVAPIQLMAARGALHAYRHLLGDGIAGVRRRLGLEPIEDWEGWFSSAALQIGLWPEWFDRAGTRSPLGVRLTGFPLPDDADDEPLPPEAEEALSGPVAPVLVTGGTGRMLHQRFYTAAVEGARLAGRPVLLVVRHRDLVPDPLPPDVTWFPRLPFRAVMPRVSMVVHHGGIGTLSRALRARVPQIILAHGVDRPDNAERLRHHGLATWLPAPRWTPEEVAPLVTAAAARGPLPPDAVPEPDLKSAATSGREDAATSDLKSVAPDQEDAATSGKEDAAMPGRESGLRRAAWLIGSLAVAVPSFPTGDDPGLPAVPDGIGARRQLERLSAEQRRALARRLRGRLSGQEA
jgi:UDP:flavonoid glycosyltransferase YjiC (YdhE family)